MSRAKDRLAEFFPQSPSVVLQHQKRNITSTTDRQSSDARNPLHSSPSPNLTSLAKSASSHQVNGQHTTANTASEQRSTPFDDDEPQRVSPGDLLNTVGSASSLSSAASSVFSANLTVNGHYGSTSNMNTLTPLTNTESSPPKPLSPRSGKRTFEQMHNGSISSPYLAPADESRGASRTITPVQTPPEPSLQARPGPRTVKGVKLIYDPEVDPSLSSKERKKYKPRYKEFGAEVRSTSMRVFSLT
jgi:histone-lysine N-methyltransferase SETD1